MYRIRGAGQRHYYDALTTNIWSIGLVVTDSKMPLWPWMAKNWTCPAKVLAAEGEEKEFVVGKKPSTYKTAWIHGKNPQPLSQTLGWGCRWWTRRRSRPKTIKIIKPTGKHDKRSPAVIAHMFQERQRIGRGRSQERPSSVLMSSDKPPYCEHGQANGSES